MILPREAETAQLKPALKGVLTPIIQLKAQRSVKGAEGHAHHLRWTHLAAHRWASFSSPAQNWERRPILERSGYFCARRSSAAWDLTTQLYVQPSALQTHPQQFTPPPPLPTPSTALPTPFSPSFTITTTCDISSSSGAPPLASSRTPHTMR